MEVLLSCGGTEECELGMHRSGGRPKARSWRRPKAQPNLGPSRDP